MSRHRWSLSVRSSDMAYNQLTGEAPKGRSNVERTSDDTKPPPQKDASQECSAPAAALDTRVRVCGGLAWKGVRPAGSGMVRFLQIGNSADQSTVEKQHRYNRLSHHWERRTGSVIALECTVPELLSGGG
ncbi:Piso0_000040 [Millerozyma farinosa CBS 7064]|uniref:Piso0_000040 protein n=1 Tax=Pichia sorbitophila (strain ATCC MYA-4447 / BCRC 22081 / CBS 7064 / NBRC 10061 / NRRL Y-12695) TaxID=559304 RepID=G8YUD6_PICSO|nr:Piso0_000040 [Millerozyma farinosa CBS 7064]